jgi:hypothetical protein
VAARAVTLLLLASFAPFGCSSGDSSGPDPQCVAIAQQYAAAFADAQVCDPAVPGSCSAARPVVLYEQQPDGGLLLRGICNCTNPVNPARTGQLDALLAQFGSKGCSIGSCPCPSPPPGTPAPACNATDAGMGTCAPPVF